MNVCVFKLIKCCVIHRSHNIRLFTFLTPFSSAYVLMLFCRHAWICLVVNLATSVHTFPLSCCSAFICFVGVRQSPRQSLQPGSLSCCLMPWKCCYVRTLLIQATRLAARCHSHQSNCLYNLVVSCMKIPIFHQGNNVVVHLKEKYWRHQQPPMGVRTFIK